MPDKTTAEKLRSLFPQISPGTELREGLDRILNGATGALIVLGHDEVVEDICSGGFQLNVKYSPTRLRELAKMDGAIVCDRQAHHIIKAAVQLMPDANIETNESGTRHRTAQRVSRQTGYPVISVSKSMRTIGLYLDGARYVLNASDIVLARGTQALATLERYRTRLDQVTDSLSALEIEDMVTVRDVTSALQRQEMLRRISQEIEDDVIELGTDGRLLALQHAELTTGLAQNSELVIRDYVSGVDPQTDLPLMLKMLSKLDDNALIADLTKISQIIGLGGDDESLDSPVHPAGYRLLAYMKKPVPPAIADRLVAHFGSLQNLMAATLEDLMEVEGVGEQRARNVHDGLYKISDASVLERFI
ncbi:MAG: DNA integrity scanning diadenylate cyclase DisA [Micrococcaceae bacterium]